MKTKEYEVSFNNESADDNPNRPWFHYGTYDTLTKAKSVAKKLSKEKFETDIRGECDGDVIHHSFYSKGKLTIQTV